MKKTLLTLCALFSFVLAISAQTVYTETFTGTSLPTGWADASPNTTFTLTVNNELMVTMTDSVGPQQPSGPAANWTAFTYMFANAVNMDAGCECISFDIDNSSNQEISFAVQVQDITHVGGTTNSQYTDATSVTVAAGYIGTVTVNYADKFRNYYGVVPNKVDSTQIKQINFQPLGAGLGSAPWNKKFKGNFTMDNVTVAGVTTSLKGAESIASSKLYPNPVSDMAKVELNLKSSSAVKVTLSDLMGKEVMTVADGTFSELTKEFSVSNLNKGIYTVNYFVNGSAAKAEMLMVK
jgi:hypothetical protein